MNFINFVVAHFSEIISAIVALLTALTAIFLLIPGPHPEDWFQQAKDFLEKFSRKPDSK